MEKIDRFYKLLDVDFVNSFSRASQSEGNITYNPVPSNYSHICITLLLMNVMFPGVWNM